MMTKEEVAEIIHYCKINGVTYKDRLKELNIAAWKFYDYKAKYAAEESSAPVEGAFLQLMGSSEVVPMPSFVAKCGKKPKSKLSSSSSSVKNLSIELRTPIGTMMRISGDMDSNILQSIIQAAGGHV